jgi:CheY-like chemotaxis protein
VTWNPAEEEIGLEPAAPCVLVVDDDPDMLEEVTRGLRCAGCAVIAVDSGDQLIDYLGRCAAFGGRFLVPDVIVSDIRMPGYSGFDLLEALHHAQCHTPVILMTAFGDEETHERAKRLGAVATFDKPFDADDMSTAVFWAWDTRAASSIASAPQSPRRRYGSRLRYGEGLRDRDRDGAEYEYLSSDEAEVERRADLNLLHFPHPRSNREE